MRMRKGDAEPHRVSIDEEEVRRMLCMLGHEPGGVWEIRVLNRRDGYAAAGLFDDVDACVREVSCAAARGNVYVSLQGREAEGVVADNEIRCRREMTKDNEVLRVRNFGLDLDAVRPSGVPASETELGAVMERGHAVSSLLERLGLPRPGVVFTGNGVQLFVPVREVSIEEFSMRLRCRGLFRGFESVLQMSFGDSRVQIDSITNWSRVVRLPGTLNVKGEPSETRPWRMARIVWALEERADTTADVFASILQRVGTTREGPRVVCEKTTASPSPFDASLAPCGAQDPAEGRPEATGARTAAEEALCGDSLGPGPRGFAMKADCGSARGSDGRLTLPACSALCQLWKTGHAEDRSKALWAAELHLTFEGVSEELAIAALRKFDVAVVGKLQPNEAEKYLRYWYRRAQVSEPSIPCRWFRSIGTCPGVAACDYGKHSIELDARSVVGRVGVEVAAVKEKAAMWNPKETLLSLDVKPGDYDVVIVDAFDGVSKNSGSEMTTVVFQPEDGTDIQFYDWFVKGHPVAARRMLSLLSAVGMMSAEKVETKDLIGKRLCVKIAVEKFQGLPQPRVRRFEAFKGESVKRLT